jgi:hypothetical protein
METRGHLRELDLAPWRWIYIDYLLRLPEDQLAQLLGEVNEIFAALKQRGAMNVAALSAADVEERRPPDKRLPMFDSRPFRFSEPTLVAAKGALGMPPAPVRNPRIVSLRQREKDILVRAQAEAPDAEFTIHDYVQVKTSLLRCDPFEPVQLLVEDPAVFRSTVVLNILAELSAQGA